MNLNVEQFEVSRFVARRTGEVAGGKPLISPMQRNVVPTSRREMHILAKTGRLARLGARVAAVRSDVIAPKADEPNYGVGVRVNSYLPDAR